MDPNSPSSRLRHTHAQRTEEQLGQKAEAGRQFDSVEEMLRFDAANTALPPALESRLQDSIASEKPPEKAPWWKRLFGG